MDAIDFSPEQRARVLRKLDWHLLPPVALLYLLSSLDRTNFGEYYPLGRPHVTDARVLGNARIAGMAKDLKLGGLKYNTAAAIFFATFCAGQVPSNVILKLFRPSRWIPIMMVAWGLVMTLMCLVNTYPQLLVARVFLGLAEAGLAPGMTYYISLWYPRADRGKRMAIFIAAATVAGAFSGILAYAIEKMEGIGGLHGWQWIFCLEGLATVLVGLVAPFLMHDNTETAPFLTEAERHYITELMKTDSQGLATHFKSQFVLQGLMDYKTYLQFGSIVGFGITAYAIALFTPTILNGLGFAAANAQLLSICPFIATCVTTVLGGIYSDRHKVRGPYVVAGAIVGLVGCIILYMQTKPSVGIVGVVLTAMGVYPPIPIILAWTSSNAGGDVKRSVAIATVTSLASAGGICGSFIFFDPPRFHIGLAITMGLLVFSLLTCLFTMWDYNRINKQKEKWCDEHGITDERNEEFKDKGDDSPLFRYTL
ncbi:MFS general substrate transporter [Boletus edulis]|uniref:Major facilitator superfamily domain-containing protein n=1 Tax=Boletus edulis BED1 TaxID=1328754 RepID=A0AAD4GJ76_BOLED|nr:MFS general substrate transporter [Boletus edulis]KAF8447325.1 major facilitator superfamily domain-containing protein [Boletus edulis BED1]